MRQSRMPNREDVLAVFFAFVASVTGGDALRARLDSLVVMPSTGPVAHVSVRNVSDSPATVTVRVGWPEGWTAEPASQQVQVPAASAVRTPFAITKAVDAVANSYPVTVETVANGRVTRQAQDVVCATSPHLTPEMDGKLDDWVDAVPVSFAHGGRKTTVMTCWNRKQVCIAVRIEEGALTVLKELGKGGRIDAVQFALAPSGGGSRYEFVVVPVSSWRGAAQAYLFANVAGGARAVTKERDLAGAECESVAARARHRAGVTEYEIGVPVSLVPELRPTTGRTYCFSLLVHDAEQSSVRDLGTAMNRWECERDPAFWTRWRGSAFGDMTPFDGSIEFGFSSSIH